MPTVPTEQNRVGVAGVTDAKLQPGDYSGTGLQALGAGMRQLGGTGATIAGEMQERQDRDDDLEVKRAWNAYAEGARGIRADALGKFDTDSQGMLDSMTRDYGGLRDWISSGLKNERQRARFDHVIAERFDYDISGALSSAEQAMRRGQNQQSVLLEQNAANDAVDNSDNPALFDKHLQTGAESIARRAMARGDDPAVIERSVTAYGSGIRRRVVQGMIDHDPVAAANRYRLMRDDMTPADRQATEETLFEPLARALAATEVDKLLLPEERDGTLSLDRRAAITQGIEAMPLTEALKRYAQDDLDDRGSLQARTRKHAVDTARETSLATAEHLGPGFTSITQIPAAVRRDLDDATDLALRSLALANLDPTPVASGGETSLMMNIMASENPAAFAKEDLRLIRGKVTLEEYDRLARLQRGQRDFPSVGNAATRHRIIGMLSTFGSIGMVRANSPTAGHSNGIFRADDSGTGTEARFIKIGQDGGSFGQDRAVAWELARRHGDDPEKVHRDMLGLPRRELAGPRTLTPLHKRLKELAEKYPPDPGTREWDTSKAIEWKTVGGRSFIFDFKDKWVHGYRRAIVAAAKEFDLPPELVAGVAYNEVGGDPSWADAAAFNIRGRKEKRRTSFGSLSLQVRSAADSLGYTNPGSWQDAAIIGSLNNSQENIFIAAKFLARLRNIDFKGRSANSLSKDDIAIIASRYNRGPGLSLDKIKKDTQYGRAITKRIDHIKKLLR